MNKNKGFTLLEAVIAVFLLSLIALVCAMALRIGISTYEKNQKYTTKFESQTINYYRLFEQLKHTCGYKDRGPKSYVLFKGKSEQVEFITSLSLAQPGIAGFFRVEYSYQDGKLWLREMRILDTSYLYKDWQDGEKKELLSGLQALNFQYFDGKDWQDEWEKPILPQAIKVTIEKQGQSFSFIVPFIIGKVLELAK